MEEILYDKLVILSKGAQVGDTPTVRIQATATRVTINPWNSDADDLLDGELVLPLSALKEVLNAVTLDDLRKERDRW